MTNYAGAKKDCSPAGGSDPTKCAFIIKGSCKNGAASSFKYDRSTPDTPRSEPMNPAIMAGPSHTKEKTTSGTTDEAQPEEPSLAGAQAGAEDTTILERRLARTLGTDPVPRSQSSSDRILELPNTWSTKAGQNADNPVAFHGTNSDNWAAQLRYGQENSSKTLSDTATAPKKEDNNVN